MALVSLLDVSLSFGGAPLLDRVNLQIERGERVCLVGRNGAGKSTLMKVIANEMKPDLGQVFRQPGAVFSTLRQEVPAGLTGKVRTVVAGAARESGGTQGVNAIQNGNGATGSGASTSTAATGSGASTTGSTSSGTSTGSGTSSTTGSSPKPCSRGWSGGGKVRRYG